MITEEFPPSNECICDKSEYEPSVNNGVTSSATNKEFNATSDWHPVSFVWRFLSARVEHASSGSSRRGLQDRDSQHGGSLTDTRTEIASAIELPALKPGSPVRVLTAGRDVCEERLSVWPISGDKWIMVSPDGTLIDVPTTHLVALRDVTANQTYPREVEQIDQFELPVSDEDFRNYKRSLL